MTPAMSKALELHQPRGLMPVGYESDPDQVAAYTLLNRARASLLNDDWAAKVFAFHRLYKMPGGDGPIAPLSSMRALLRQRLRDEENRETTEALDAGDIAEHIDGCLDLIYVCIGELLELGLTPTEINQAMEEVHASNMTKTNDAGEPVFDEGGKVLKGANYVKADIGLVVNIPVKTSA